MLINSNNGLYDATLFQTCKEKPSLENTDNIDYCVMV